MTTFFEGRRGLLVSSPWFYVEYLHGTVANRLYGSPLANSPGFVQSHRRMNGLKDLSVSATSEAEMRALFI